MPIFSRFGADFFTVYADFSRFVRDINGEKKKNISLSMSFFTVSFSRFPKGPFRTKNTTTIVKIVNYYAVVFLLRPPNLVRRGPFFERKNVCNSQGKGVRTRCAAIVNHPAVLKILRVVNLLRVVFLVRRGPLGCPLSNYPVVFLVRWGPLGSVGSLQRPPGRKSPQPHDVPRPQRPRDTKLLTLRRPPQTPHNHTMGTVAAAYPKDPSVLKIVRRSDPY